MIKIHCLASQILHMKPFFFGTAIKNFRGFSSSTGIVGVLRRMFGWCNVVRCENIGPVADIASNHKMYMNLMKHAAISLSFPGETPPYVSWEDNHDGAFVIAVHCSSCRKMSALGVGVRKTVHEVKSSLVARHPAVILTGGLDPIQPAQQLHQSRRRSADTDSLLDVGASSLLVLLGLVAALAT